MAGASYFDPALKGQPVRWQGGVVSYYTDQGPLAPSVDNPAANNMVAAAAAVWNQVPTAAVQITAAGTLAEDVSGNTITSGASGVTLPADVQSTATNRPVAIVYDADGAVLDALYGAGASDPLGCRETTVTVLLDNLATNATIAHALVLLNGRCLGTAAQLQQMQYDLIRGFGTVLGLDWTQANDAMYMSGRWTAQGLAGWPIMHPLDFVCAGKQPYQCLPNPMSLRVDDVAGVSRVYPVTAQNQAQYPGKQVTAAATISLHGTIRFHGGQGMQGVNVVARPLVAGTNTPDDGYPAAAVSGFAFHGDQGNPVNGYSAADGSALTKLGSDDPALEGWYDLSGITLPSGVTQADYEITLEPVNPLYLASTSVGPYTLGSPTPSGTMPTVIVRGLRAGSSTVQDITIPDSADDSHSGDDGSETRPALLARSGEWTGRVSGYGHTGWFAMHVRGNRIFTFEAEPLDEHGQMTQDKARLVLGVWNGTDAVGSSPVLSTAQPFNGQQQQTYLNVLAPADTAVRLGVADQRGDGRPDYLYRGRLLYADTVTPQRVPLSGGTVTITGRGFRSGNQVLVNGVTATVTELTPTQIVASLPGVAQPAGSVDVTVMDPATLGYATVQGALSFDAASADVLTVVAAPSGNPGLYVPVPFTVQALAGDLQSAAAGVAVTYSVTSGSATVSPCGAPSCSVTTDGRGLATVSITAKAPGTVSVTAAISSGASVHAVFTPVGIPAIRALTAPLYVARGVGFGPWTIQALAQSTGPAKAGQSVTWSAGSGVTLSSSVNTTDAHGIATVNATVGPLGGPGTARVTACVPFGTSSACASFLIISGSPAVAQFVAVSGTAQHIGLSDATAPVVLEVQVPGNHPLAGGTVHVFESLRAWTPDCPQHGRCAAAPVLATQNLALTSGADGLVSFAPLTLPGVATRLSGTAMTGNSAVIAFSMERHP